MKTLCKLLIIIALPCFMISCKDSEIITEPYLALAKEELSFTGYESSLAVKVDATRQWKAVASASWFTVSPDSYPSANEHFTANVAIAVSNNESDEPREGYVTFSLNEENVATLRVKQDVMDENDRPNERFPITWANLQWSSSTIIEPGQSFEAGSCVFADGITNVLESTTGESIVCQIGYSLNNTDPSEEGWHWAECPFNGDWGNNFYYQGRIENLVVGTYYYTFRFKNGSSQYKYAGSGGLWDGIDNVNGKFEVKNKDEEIIDYSKYDITWANIQWAASVSIPKGSTFEAGGQVFIDGLTNLENASTNGDWGSNFYYQGRTSEITISGIYYYTFRFKMGESGEYVYAGTDGKWDGIDSTNGSFHVVD